MEMEKWVDGPWMTTSWEFEYMNDINVHKYVYIYMITLCFKEPLWALIEFIYSSIFIHIWNTPTSQYGVIELSPATTTSIVVTTYIAHILQLQKCGVYLFALGRGSSSPNFDQHFSNRNSFVSLVNSWHHKDFLNLLIFQLMFYAEPTLVTIELTNSYCKLAFCI